jgi:hypothetical protein
MRTEKGKLGAIDPSYIYSFSLADLSLIFFLLLCKRGLLNTEVNCTDSEPKTLYQLARAFLFTTVFYRFMCLKVRINVNRIISFFVVVSPKAAKPSKYYVAVANVSNKKLSPIGNVTQLKGNKLAAVLRHS